ncbi:oligosaccharide flippase family protein [Thermosphaera aggregans]|jgi:O-antigen/teichoic acid export membrane protein|uniref:Polysaccharide biosynthesis protein n=1 Tax=Thermosphaera aggregans (strain DSM 11486 / M11TL) TaxID=633148 RepID=D5U0U3_THEAM|nr:oligosaccharide flippase family protein [Thermosphaera aggregans]ADG90743.1 polysaccharide biosynthesis protein [Thermosphaera aggregans DSM 11486]
MNDEQLGNVSFQAVIYGFTTLFQIIIQVFTMMYISRILGPELYGLYNLSLVPLTFLLMFSDLGFNAALFRYSSISHSKRNYCIIRKAFFFNLKMLFAINLGLSLPLLIFPSELSVALTQRGEISRLVMLTGVTPLAHALFGMSISILAAVEDAEKRAFLQVLQGLVRIVAAIILFSSGYLVEGAVASYIISYIVVALLGLFFVKPFISGRDKCSLETNDYVKFAVSMFIPGLLTGILSRLVSIKLAYATAPLGELGNYVFGNFNAASAFLGAVLSIYGSLATPLLPYLSYQLSNGNNAVRSAERLTNIFNATLIPLSVFALFFSDKVITIVYGVRYGLAPGYFTLMGISLLTFHIGVVYSTLFQVMNDKKIIMLNGLATFIFGVIFLEILSSMFGALGIALTVGLYNVFSHIFYFVYGKTKYKTNIEALKALKTLFSTIISCLVSYVTVSMITGFILTFTMLDPTGLFLLRTLSLLLAFTITLQIYAFLMAVLGGLDEVDIAFIEKMFSRIKFIGWFVEYLARVYKKIYYASRGKARRETL